MGDPWLKPLSDVAIKLVEELHSACGFVFLPQGLRKVGQETISEALKNKTAGGQKAILSEEEVKHLTTLDMQEKFYRNQYRNQCKTVSIALDNLDDAATPEKIDSEWTMDFLDKAKNINSSSAQHVWGNLLAEKARNPASFSKRLLHNLYIMDNEHAEAFTQLTKYCFFERDSEMVHSIIFFKEQAGDYASSSLTTHMLYALSQFGLIECNFELGYVFHEKRHFVYMGNVFTVESKDIDAGNVRLTKDGNDLFHIAEKRNSKKILEYTMEMWSNKGYKVTYPLGYLNIEHSRTDAMGFDLKKY